MGKKYGTVVIILLIVFFLYEGATYFYMRSANAISDAAFIRSDRIATLSFNVGGKIVTMLKKENDPVKKGELLARIDPIDLATAKTELENRIQSIDAEIELLALQKERITPGLMLQTDGARDEVESVRNETAAMEHQIEAAQARCDKLSADERRYAKMLDERLIAQGDYESVHTQAVSAKNDVEALKLKRAAYRSLQAKAQTGMQLSQINQKQTAELEAKIASLAAQKKAMESSMDDLRHKIGYTELYAPFDGVIAKKFTEAPSIVKQGTPVYALNDPSSLYAEVLLSEKELHGIHPGNKVTLEVDAIGSKAYRGTVESIASASASTFSLVPRDIASGEFTKLDQRFTIRIKLDDITDLRAGMGTTVIIERT